MNGKTSMSEEGKVCHVDEAMLLSYQAGRKFELVKKRFCQNLGTQQQQQEWRQRHF